MVTKSGEHIPCGYSMPTIWAFDNVSNSEKKKILPLTKKNLTYTKNWQNVTFVDKDS